MSFPIDLYIYCFSAPKQLTLDLAFKILVPIRINYIQILSYYISIDFHYFTLSGADGGVGPQGPGGAKGPQGKDSRACPCRHLYQSVICIKRSSYYFYDV